MKEPGPVAGEGSGQEEKEEVPDHFSPGNERPRSMSDLEQGQGDLSENLIMSEVLKAYCMSEDIGFSDERTASQSIWPPSHNWERESLTSQGTTSFPVGSHRRDKTISGSAAVDFSQDVYDLINAMSSRHEAASSQEAGVQSPTIPLLSDEYMSCPRVKGFLRGQDHSLKINERNTAPIFGAVQLQQHHPLSSHPHHYQQLNQLQPLHHHHQQKQQQQQPGNAAIDKTRRSENETDNFGGKQGMHVSQPERRGQLLKRHQAEMSERSEPHNISHHGLMPENTFRGLRPDIRAQSQLNVSSYINPHALTPHSSVTSLPGVIEGATKDPLTPSVAGGLQEVTDEEVFVHSKSHFVSTCFHDNHTEHAPQDLLSALVASALQNGLEEIHQPELLHKPTRHEGNNQLKDPLFHSYIGSNFQTKSCSATHQGHSGQYLQQHHHQAAAGVSHPHTSQDYFSNSWLHHRHFSHTQPNLSIPADTLLAHGTDVVKGGHHQYNSSTTGKFSAQSRPTDDANHHHHHQHHQHNHLLSSTDGGFEPEPHVTNPEYTTLTPVFRQQTWDFQVENVLNTGCENSSVKVLERVLALSPGLEDGNSGKRYSESPVEHTWVAGSSDYVTNDPDRNHRETLIASKAGKSPQKRGLSELLVESKTGDAKANAKKRRRKPMKERPAKNRTESFPEFTEKNCKLSEAEDAIQNGFSYPTESFQVNKSDIEWAKRAKSRKTNTSLADPRSNDCYSAEVKQNGHAKEHKLPPCKICGDKASGVHFGVNSCEACNEFFRRTLKYEKSYMCAREKDCDVSGSRRNVCTYCRHQRCIRAGMSRTRIKTGRYSHKKKTMDALEIKQIQAESEFSGDELFLENLVQKVRAVFYKYRHLDVDFEEDELARRQLEFYKSYSNRKRGASATDGLDLDKQVIKPPINTSEKSRKTDYVCDLQDSVDSVKENAESDTPKDGAIQCDDTNERTPAASKICMKMWENWIIDFIHLLKEIPGFHKLSLRDQMALIKTSIPQWYVLNDFRGYDSSLGVLTKASGQSYHYDEWAELFSANYVENVFRLAEKLKRMRPSPTVVMLLKIIVITSPDLAELQDRKGVEDLNEIYIRCLLHELRKGPKDAKLSVPSACARSTGNPNWRRKFTDIVSALVDLRTIANSYNKEMFLSETLGTKMKMTSKVLCELHSPFECNTGKA